MQEIIKSLKKRKLIFIAMVVFWSVFLIILFTHLLTGTAPFKIKYSISQYVGFSFLSSIAFLLTNIYVSFLIWNALKDKIKDKTARLLLKIIIITLIGLSVFPISFYDNIITDPVIFGRAPISLLHVITSRTMFLSMAALSLYTFFTERKSTNISLRAKIAISFTVYAGLCIMLFMFFPEVFWGLNLIIESLYIQFFFIFVASL